MKEVDSQSVLRYARACVDRAKQQPSFSGQSGHRRIYWVALMLYWGFAGELSEGDAWLLLSEFNLAGDPESTRHLKHAVGDAKAGRSCKKPRGWMIERMGGPKTTNQQRGPERMPNVYFDEIAQWLIDRCPLEDQSDVETYVASRKLMASSAVLFALPHVREQKALAADMCEQFGASKLNETGLFGVTPASKDVDLSRFAFPFHRLCICWVDPAGFVDTIERRVTDSSIEGGNNKRWVFPRHRGPQWPLGCHELWNDKDMRPVTIVEGPTDYMAVRTMNYGNPVSPITIALQNARSTLAPEWVRPILGRHVTVALDGDTAGETAAQGIMAQLTAIGVQCTRQRPPVGCKDWAEALMKR
jgi:hypothetical protein